MKTEIIEKTKNEVGMPTGSWGAGENVQAEDIVISHLHLTQGLSKAVQDGSAKPGDIIDNETGEKFGDLKSPVPVLVFKMQKYWEIYRKVIKNGKEVEERVRRDLVETFGDTEYEFHENGEMLFRRRNYVFLCCLISKLGIKTFPYVVRMRKSAQPTAKSLMKTFATMAADGKPSAAKVIELSGEKTERDGQSYNVWSFSVGRDSTKDELKAAYAMYQQFEAAKEKYTSAVATTDEEEVSAVASTQDDGEEVF